MLPVPLDSHFKLFKHCWESGLERAQELRVSCTGTHLASCLPMVVSSRHKGFSYLAREGIVCEFAGGNVNYVNGVKSLGLCLRILLFVH